jgi:hypothetical protein
MESDLAILTALLVMVPKVDVHFTCTTTLGVLHNCSFFLARSDLLADGVVGHLIVKLKVTVELDRHLDLTNGEAFLFGAAVERSGSLSGDLVLDAF